MTEQNKTFPANNNSITINAPAPGAAEAKAIIEYWSSLPYFTKHLDPTKKAYSMSVWLLKTLFEGKQGEKLALDDDFLSDNGIYNEELCHKFTVEEIKAAIDKYSQMYSPEFIADKSKWSRSLDYFIYNPVTKRSFFLTLTGDREIPGAPLKMLEPKAVYYYQHYFWYGKDLNTEQQNLLIRNINYITMQQHAFEEKMGQWCYYNPLNGFGFYRYHLKYIEQEYQDREGFDIKHLGPMTFAGFSIWLKENYNVNLNPSHQEIEAAKAKYIEDTAIIAENLERESKIGQERLKWSRARHLKQKMDETTISEIGPRIEALEQNTRRIEDSNK